MIDKKKEICGTRVYSINFNCNNKKNLFWRVCDCDEVNWCQLEFKLTEFKTLLSAPNTKKRICLAWLVAGREGLKLTLVKIVKQKLLHQIHNCIIIFWSVSDTLPPSVSSQSKLQNLAIIIWSPGNYQPSGLSAFHPSSIRPAYSGCVEVEKLN